MPDPGAYHYYVPVTVAAGVYGAAQAVFDFLALGVRFHNTGADPVRFSLDGVTDHGRVAGSESFELTDFLASGRLYLKRESGIGAPVVHVTVWG